MANPQFFVSLVVVFAAILGGSAWAEQREVLAAQSKTTAMHQLSDQLLRQRIATVLALQQEAASTYSWISPVSCSAQPCIALTFDDGPNGATTPQILNTLEKEHVTASFFVIGSRVVGNGALLQRMYADGDEIGNHSWTHPDFTTLKPDQVRQQVMLTQGIIESTGVPAPTLFRPPYGAVNPTVLHNVPLTVMFWNEDPKDWSQTDPQQIQQTILNAAKPGGVVDLHDIYQSTADALDPTIQKLKSEHYQFVTVSQLLGLKPGQQGTFYGYRPEDFQLGGE